MEHFAPADLTGCRYKAVQRRRYESVPSTHSSVNRRERLAAARRVVFDLFPSKPSLGDPKSFLRIDIPVDDDERYLATLEALAAGANIITAAVLEYEHAGRLYSIELDALVRRADGSYLPVLVSNHRVARPAANKSMKVMSTSRLGLGTAYRANYKVKSHALDSFTVALAARALEEMGVGSHRAGLIGQDRTLVFLLDTDLLQQGLQQALDAAPQVEPRRIKDCASCRFWPMCERELVATDELSLFLAGDKARPYREMGINTVQGLIDADLGEPSRLARAWREQVPVLRRKENVSAPRFDVEIDIDVEAYLDQGAYLWGTFDGVEYRPFVTWDGVGGHGEAENFAAFWRWLSARRERAAAEGKSLGVFCYSSHGENHWLRFSARRFASLGIPGLPSEEEITRFIQSDHWIDVFAYVRTQLVGPSGLGLKVVAPQAGFHWVADDVDGEESVNLYRVATGKVDGADPEAARSTLLSYNGDDCRATAAVRDWLSRGALDAPVL